MEYVEERDNRPPRPAEDRPAGGRFGDRGDRPGGFGDRGDRPGGFGDRGDRPGGPGGDRPGGFRGRRFGGGGGGGRFGQRRKVCLFCVDKVEQVDYKDVSRLRRYISDRAKIEPRRKTGTCAKHQRSLTVAIKRARHVALLPFTTASR